MKELHFEYRMKLSFDSPVEKHRFTLKCVPRSDTRQQILTLQTSVHPKEFLSSSLDSFGNYCIYGYSEGKHDYFGVTVSGTARTGLADLEPAGEDYQIGLFKYQTACTYPGPAVRTFFDQVSAGDKASNLERALRFMDALYERFVYQPGATVIGTTAEQALSLGCGVCQDYSHILLSLCRLARIPCRYVVGMLMGEGLSHAWVEIFDGGSWLALDPTNHLIVGDQHIKISSGRDYRDCMINQGIFVGRAAQRQEISVRVTEEETERIEKI